MPGAAATNFAVQITKWTAPAPQEDPYLSEPLSPAMKRVLLELSPQSTLAAEEAARKLAAASEAAPEAPPLPPAHVVAFREEQAKKEREVAEFKQRVREEINREIEIQNQGPAPVWRLASEVEAQERIREELFARETAQAQAQVAEFDEVAEPPAPAPPPLPGQGRATYSDPVV